MYKMRKYCNFHKCFDDGDQYFCNELMLNIICCIYLLLFNSMFKFCISYDAKRS